MNGLGKLPLPQLELFSLLVYYGLKDAYLVDCCCLDDTQAITYLNYFHLKYALTSGTLLILQLEGDLLFANRPVLVRKIGELSQKNNTVVVDMSGGLTIVEHSDAYSRVLHSAFCGILALDSTTTAYIVQETDLLRSIVGLPFVAGWLLGYPCLYRSIDYSPGDSKEQSEDLFINLLKMSITVTVDVQQGSKTPKAKGKASTAPNLKMPPKQTVEVMGFSIPESLSEGSPEVRIKLQTACDSIVAVMRSQAEYINMSHAGLKVTDIHQEHRVHTVPKIAL